MFNRAQLIGHLGRDPETRRLGSGDPVVNFRLATSQSWKDKATGERKEQTEWHSVVIYNEALCRIAEQYVRKGSKVMVEGQLRTRKWSDANGVERYSTEVVLGRFNGQLLLLDKADRAAPEESSYGTTRSREDARPGPEATRGTGAPRPGYDLDDDIPF